MNKSTLLTIDGILNVVLGVLLIAFPVPVVEALGIPAAQGFYPNRQPGTATQVPTVSGALVKGMILASADFMTGVNLTRNFRWNNEQGAGRVQLDNVLPIENWPASPSGLIVHDTLNGVINISDLSMPASISQGGSTGLVEFQVCNDTEELPEELYRTATNTLSVFPSLQLEPGPKAILYLGAELKGVNSTKDPESLVEQTRPYGAGQFGEVAVRLGLS